MRRSAGAICIQARTADFPAIRHGAYNPARFGHRNSYGSAVKVVGGKAALAILGVGQFVLGNPQKRRCIVLCVSLGYFGLSLQKFRFLLPNMIGKRAVIDQGRIIRKIVRRLLETGIHRSSIKIRLNSVQPLFEFFGILFQICHRGILLLADAAACGNFIRQRH